jgi:hypothetical protein
MKPITRPNIDIYRKQEEPSIQLSGQAITAFISLIGLTAIIITQLKIYDFNRITILLILMFLVLIYGFWGKLILRKIKIYQEEKKQNKLAKIHFETFKKLVFQFEEFTVDNHADNIQRVMEDLKNNSGITEFSQLNVIPSLIIQYSYTYFAWHLDKFNKITKVGLGTLAEQFETILDTYYTLYVKESAKNIKTCNKELPQKYKEQYNNARLKYIGFRENYKKFSRDANEDFKEGTWVKLKDYFYYPEEL